MCKYTLDLANSLSVNVNSSISLAAHITFKVEIIAIEEDRHPKTFLKIIYREHEYDSTSAYVTPIALAPFLSSAKFPLTTVKACKIALTNVKTMERLSPT